jgi:capsular polysaccharide biosynthesis protein
MKTIYPESISYRKPPLNLNHKDIKLFEHEYKKTIHATTILELKNCYILNGMIFSTNRLKFYNNYSLIHPIRKKDYIKNLLLLKNKKTTIESAIWITDENAYGYFHWITDCLSRLMATESFNAYEAVVLPIRLKEIKFINESLSYFNITPIYYHKEIPVFIKNLLLPSHTANTGNYNTHLINKLKQKIVGDVLTPPTKNVYISRQKAEKRKIINETEVVNILQKHNFEIHFFEDYSFTQQVNLMKETTCLISLHGAGLTNMLFMQENTTILELRNENDSTNNCYFSLANDLNLNYYYQVNKGDSNDTHIVNIEVDIELLEKNIKLMNAI